MINHRPPTWPVTIVWAPPHTGIPGKRDHQPRGSRFHSLSQRWWSPARVHASCSDRLGSYSALWPLGLFYRTYSSQHKSLPINQERLLRTLWAYTFPHNTRIHLFDGTQLSPFRCSCGEPGNLKHIVGGCDKCAVDPPNLHVSIENWETAMASSGLEDQLLLMETAADSAPSNEVASLKLWLDWIKLHFLSLSLSLYKWSLLPLVTSLGYHLFQSPIAVTSRWRAINKFLSPVLPYPMPSHARRPMSLYIHSFFLTAVLADKRWAEGNFSKCHLPRLGVGATYSSHYHRKHFEGTVKGALEHFR